MDSSFGELLRRFRGAAQLTQASLAERSGVGVETIRSLESGRRKSPRGDTLQSLADALGLTGEDRAGFVAAAAGPNREAVPHELPADVQDFTGRGDEVRRLVGLLAAPGTIVISGPAGSGKTALAVHAARRVTFPAGEIFVNRPCTAASIRVPEGGLVVLDNVESPEQVPRATNGAVVITSRKPLPAAENCVELGGLPAADAVRLLHRIVGPDRWQQDLTATLEVVELCGGMPTALRRAAARMIGRPSWSPADLRGWLLAGRAASTT
ncbi:helix-turn-helix domain-containing protein [Kribbella sp. NPDC056345]|uniref:helix-turn-helix transcriptional regulator n=1 Tax=Kribbella sp. NPDC056345 TaxID=3345789 RepID=UPI0035DEE769